MTVTVGQMLTSAWHQPSCRRVYIFSLAVIVMTVVCLGGVMLLWEMEPIPVNDEINSQLAKYCSMMKTVAKPIGREIPKIFHQTYKTSMLPTAYRKNVAKCRNLNPDWQYFLWRDEDIEAFMTDHFPQYKRKYRRFRMNVQRADFIRYMVLHHYGGIYLDMDVECVKPFYPNLEVHAAFVDQERREHAQILFNREFTAMNSAMGSAAGHPFYLSMLESVNSGSEEDMSDAGITTGPDRLTLVYRDWVKQPACTEPFPVTLLEPVIFSPIMDMTQNFHSYCEPVIKGSGAWRKRGCELLKAKSWRSDGTDNQTIGRHLFLHMGYHWGPKSKSYFDAKELGPLTLYKVDRMRN